MTTASKQDANDVLREQGADALRDSFDRAAKAQRLNGSQATGDGLAEWDAGDEPGIIPPRQWLLGNQFCRSFISCIVAAGGTGKSALRLLQFSSLALAPPLSAQ